MESQSRMKLLPLTEMENGKRIGLRMIDLSKMSINTIIGRVKTLKINLVLWFS